MKRRTKQELEQLLADALAEQAQQAQTIRELNESVGALISTIQGLQHELESALADNGIEGARRWLAEHIGYDLRQVVKCPTCLGVRTTPTSPEQVGAEFRCTDCGQVFYVVKVLDTHPQTIRRAINEAKFESYGSVVDVKVESVVTSRQLPAGHK